jgi:hypothetical protein
MSKKINIVLQNGGSSLVDFENIHIDQISSIFSFSCDMINCSVASFFDQTKFWVIVDLLLDKLKPNGQLMLSLYDTKRLAFLYANGQVNVSDYLGLTKSINNCISLPEVISFLSKKQDIVFVDTKRDQLIVNITLAKSAQNG